VKLKFGMSLENGVGMTGIKYGVGEELRET
jgi:hypothetical protein